MSDRSDTVELTLRIIAHHPAAAADLPSAQDYVIERLFARGFVDAAVTTEDAATYRFFKDEAAYRVEVECRAPGSGSAINVLHLPSVGADSGRHEPPARRRS